MGKTTIAASVARRSGANFVRIDAIETGLALAVVGQSFAVGAAGYQIGNQIVRSMLLERLDVVVDAVNPVAAARQGWADVADELGVDCLFIEVVCSDAELHRRRIETRSADLPGHEMPTWHDVTRLTYEPWPDADIVVDTADGDDGAVEAIVAIVNQSESRNGR